jgi:hypothetical protein
MRLYCTPFNLFREHGGLKCEDEKKIGCKNISVRDYEITQSN